MKASPPKGYVAWSEDTFNRLVAAPPETLTSSFKVTHAMLLGVLDRLGDGCRALKSLLTDNHEDRRAQRHHIRNAIAMYRSLIAAGALERFAVPDERGRWVRVTRDLQADFALNQPLSPFVLDVVPRLDTADSDWALDVVSVIESTLENPGPVLAAQLDKLRTETVTRLKAEGVEYEDRMAVLESSPGRSRLAMSCTKRLTSTAWCTHGQQISTSSRSRWCATCGSGPWVSPSTSPSTAWPEAKGWCFGTFPTPIGPWANQCPKTASPTS